MMAYLHIMQMNLIERFFSFSFYQNALLGGLAIALLCGFLSVGVVQKRMAFIGQGISHAAFGGVGVALVLELSLPAFRSAVIREIVVALFCITTALLIGYISRRRRIAEDSAIGICLVSAMALGVLLMNLKGLIFENMAGSGTITLAELGYTPSFEDILFGSILSISPNEVLWIWCMSLTILTISILLYKEILFFAFDEESAAVSGVRCGFFYYGMLVVLGLTIVAAMHLLGVILSSALLIIPGAAAGFWSRNIRTVTITSIAIALLGVTCGLFLSIWLEKFSTGPVIVLTLSFFFLISFVKSRIFN